MNRKRLDDYEKGGHELLEAYRGLTKAQLLAVPIPNTWSLQQIAIHMLESDLIATDRMKRIASMERPLLIGYDETAFSKLPGVNDIDALEACQLFAANRKMTAIMLRQLPDEAFERFGVHNESGKVTLKELIDKYIEHLNGHMAHILKKKAMVTH